MNDKKQKKKVRAGFAWIFLLFPYFNWISLIVLGVCNLRFIPVISAFVYNILTSLYEDLYGLWWLLTVLQYILTYYYIRKSEDQKAKMKTVERNNQVIQEVDIRECEVKKLEIAEILMNEDMEKEEKEEERFLDLDFTNIEALRKESEIVCEALKAEEK